MTVPILRITDGTTSVSLLTSGNKSGFHLNNWDPEVAQFKDDGMWQDSQLSDGRRLVDYVYSNAVETCNLTLKGSDQDDVARRLRILDNLLVKAANYWKSDWSSVPVWIEAKSRHETNIRYAIVCAGRITQLKNPYAQPFISVVCKSIQRDILLTIERGHWLETAPGTGTAIEVSNPGRAATVNAGEVFVANKHNTAALTHIYHYDSSTGNWSTNLVAGTAFAFLPANVNDDDAVFFGVSTSGGRPFCSLVFDIGAAITNVIGIDWEYYDGAIWQPLTVQDNTNADGAMTGWSWDTLGVKSVHWAQPDDWTAGNLQTIFAGTAPSVTAFWVRAKVSSAGAGTPPTQQNRKIYTVLWPYVEVAAAQVPGDIPVLARCIVSAQHYNDQSGEIILPAAYVWLGLRSVDRGNQYTPFINLSNEQNNAGISVSAILLAGGAGSFASVQNSHYSSTGKAMVVDIGVGPNAIATISVILDSTLCPQYYGIFRVLARYFVVTKVGTQITESNVRVLFGAETIYNSETVATEFLVTDHLVDLGKVTIPSDKMLVSEVAYQLRFDLNVEVDDTVHFTELILWPVDEFAAVVYPPSGGINTYMARITDAARPGIGTSYRIDSLGNPKAGAVRAFVARGDVRHAPLVALANGSVILQASEQQRLWFLSNYKTANQSSYPFVAHSIAIDRQARYHLPLRGAQ